jgi:hypothetical protein
VAKANALLLADQDGLGERVRKAQRPELGGEGLRGEELAAIDRPLEVPRRDPFGPTNGCSHNLVGRTANGLGRAALKLTSGRRKIRQLGLPASSVRSRLAETGIFPAQEAVAGPGGDPATVSAPPG